MTLTLRHRVHSLCEVIKLKMQIKEFADFTGVSVRTLHYYDEIGLLTPASQAGNTGSSPVGITNQLDKLRFI